MVRPKITNSLKGALGEVYYKEFCDQRGWAYLSVENINNGPTGHEFTFKKGFNRIPVRIPSEVHPELESVSHPTNESAENPSFVFDFLACRVGTYDKYDVVSNPDLCWVEIKTGDSYLSKNQTEMLKHIKLPLAIFYIEDVLAPPSRIIMDWDIKSGSEWLKEFERERKS